MKRLRAHVILALVCAALIIGGCQCKKCNDISPALIGEYDYESIYMNAQGYGHCTDPHVIGIAQGGGPCAITLVGIDGWGTDNTRSVLKCEILTDRENPSFKIKPDQVIRAGGVAGCSNWDSVRVAGEGEVYAGKLLMKMTFSDSAAHYDSGEMQWTYLKR